MLANIEGMNAELIHMALSQGVRLKRLNKIAIRQMQVLTSASAIKKLKGQEVNCGYWIADCGLKHAMNENELKARTKHSGCA